MKSLQRVRTAVVVLAVAVSALVAGAAGWAVGSDGASASQQVPAYGVSLADRVTTLRASRLQQAPVQWRGGPITTSTGEVVTVHVSETFAPEVTPEYWAEFLVHLTHGSELQELTTYVAPISEVGDICGAQALGCYGRDRIITLGETLPDGTSGEAVLRHEYGHHVALYRSNTPWVAIDWGPKQWASAAGVCARVSRREAFPGDEGANYALNPGEAWAEAYRLMDERKAGIATGAWQIVSSSFYPSEAMLQAAEQDVVQPWTAAQTTVTRRAVAKGRVWWLPVSTPLDGEYSVSVAVPRGGQHDVTLVRSNRRTVVKRATRTGPRTRRISGTICGQRALYVKVVQKGTVGPVAVTVTKP